MQKHVEEHLISLGFEHGKSLFSEMSAIEIEKIFGVKVSSIQIENRANKDLILLLGLQIWFME